MPALQGFTAPVLLVLQWVGIHSLPALHISPACPQGRCLWGTELMLLALSGCWPSFLLLAVPEALLRGSWETELLCKGENLKNKKSWCCAENGGKA